MVRRQRSVELSVSGSRGGKNANVATMTANSCRQASMPAIPTAAQPAERLRTPCTAQRTNGAGELELTKIVPDERPEQRRQGDERRGRERHGLRLRLRSHQRISRRDHPPEHHILDHEQDERTGTKPVKRHQGQPDRREVIHLPDRRPLLGISRDRTDGQCPITLRQ